MCKKQKKRAKIKKFYYYYKKVRYGNGRFYAPSFYVLRKIKTFNFNRGLL
jgi:hypothetical protein